MACRDTLNVNTPQTTATTAAVDSRPAAPVSPTLYFGVDSAAPADTLLQNNLTLFDWVCRNKIQPNYWGRYLGGDHAITADELSFLHRQGCKVALLYNGAAPSRMTAHPQGVIDAKQAVMAASALNISPRAALFLEIPESAVLSDAYLLGFAATLLQDGYVPGFCANTDAQFDFDHQFSRGMQNDPDTFGQCRIWAASPILPAYLHTTNTHLIHPDLWQPHCPSGLTPDQIAVWQYGKDCHPLHDYAGQPTSFDISVVKDTALILDEMV